MFKMGDKWVLLCISHELGCRYFIGDFKDEQFLPEQHGMMNWAACGLLCARIPADSRWPQGDVGLVFPTVVLAKEKYSASEK